MEVRYFAGMAFGMANFPGYFAVLRAINKKEVVPDFAHFSGIEAQETYFCILQLGTIAWQLL